MENIFFLSLYSERIHTRIKKQKQKRNDGLRFVLMFTGYPRLSFLPHHIMIQWFIIMSRLFTSHGRGWLIIIIWPSSLFDDHSGLWWMGSLLAIILSVQQRMMMTLEAIGHCETKNKNSSFSKNWNLNSI